MLNKQQLQDGVQLRYGCSIKGMPAHCSYGNKTSIYHALDSKFGGHFSMRHDNIRDTVAFFIREPKCKDVSVEPSFLPVNALNFRNMTNTQDEARLDISVVCVYRTPFEKTFMDVRVKSKLRHRRKKFLRRKQLILQQITQCK